MSVRQGELDRKTETYIQKRDTIDKQIQKDRVRLTQEKIELDRNTERYIDR